MTMRECKCGCGTAVDKRDYAWGHKPKSGGAGSQLAKREPEIVVDPPATEETIAIEVPVRALGRIFEGMTPWQKAVAIATGLDATETQPDSEL